MLNDAELVRRCMMVRLKNDWPIAKKAGEVNVDYIEGMDLDGSPNANRKNAFDDLHVLYGFKDGVPFLIAKYECTTAPGPRYTLKPINPSGAAIIDLGYQACWQPGLHRGAYQALVQTGGACRVWRDRAKTYKRGQGMQTGWFGINRHHGGNASRTDIGGHSAGCLVTRLVSHHEESMRIVKADPRYLANKKFVFGTCVMTAAQVTGIGDQDARPRPEIKPDIPKGPAAGAGTTVTTAVGGSSIWYDYWPLFVIAAALILIGMGWYFWREPYAPPQIGDVPHA